MNRGRHHHPIIIIAANTTTIHFFLNICSSLVRHDTQEAFCEQELAVSCLIWKYNWAGILHFLQAGISDSNGRTSLSLVSLLSQNFCLV